MSQIKTQPKDHIVALHHDLFVGEVVTQADLGSNLITLGAVRQDDFLYYRVVMVNDHADGIGIAEGDVVACLPRAGNDIKVGDRVLRLVPRSAVQAVVGGEWQVFGYDDMARLVEAEQNRQRLSAITPNGINPPN